MDDKAKGDVCKPKAHVAGGLLGGCKVYLLEAAVVNKARRIVELEQALADVRRQLGRERGLR